MQPASPYPASIATSVPIKPSTMLIGMACCRLFRTASNWSRRINLSNDELSLRMGRIVSTALPLRLEGMLRFSCSALTDC